MMNCSDITKPVTDYLEGRLGLFQRLRLQLHLVICWACRRYVRQMRATIRSLKDLPPERPPSDVVSALQERFRDWKHLDGDD